jgi:NhaA family Na+:H+ antiporter
VVGAILFNIVVVGRVLKARSFWLYLIVAAPLSWWGFFKGGIHPALALVPVVPTIPHGPRDIGFFEGAEDEHPSDPLNRFEHWWKNPVELILMLFGFANAGVAFGAMGLPTMLVTVGLLAGKPIGIFLFTVVACRFLGLELPKGMTLRDLVVLGFMAGIGFTVALFVATVAFPAGVILDAAKMGALFSFGASILSLLVAAPLRVGRFSGSVDEGGSLSTAS